MDHCFDVFGDVRAGAQGAAEQILRVTERSDDGHPVLTVVGLFAFVGLASAFMNKPPL